MPLEPEPLEELLARNGVPVPKRSSALSDPLLERSFALIRELVRLATPHATLLRFHHDRELLEPLWREAQDLVHALAEERLARVNADTRAILEHLAEQERRP